ncbi:hypothetical protein EON80_20905 [bacterium]|nr:MAG: hypothetical protein EON80_20905 [bacterium]
MKKFFLLTLAHFLAFTLSGVLLSYALLMFIHNEIARSASIEDGPDAVFTLALFVFSAVGINLFVSLPLTLSTQYMQRRFSRKWHLLPIEVTFAIFCICSSSGAGLAFNWPWLAYGIINFLMYWGVFIAFRRWFLGPDANIN